MLFFFLTSGGILNFNTGLLFYSAAFALAYGAALLGSVFSVSTGPLSITTLIMQCSLIIPTLLGIIFLKDNINIPGYAGITLLFIALILVNLKNEDMKFSPVWFLWITVGFFGNGMCSSIQKLQQLRFNGGYKSEFMIIALLIVSLFTFFIGLLKNENLKETVTGSLKYAPFHGFANGVVNLFVMLLTATIPTAILFPSISAGGMAIAFIISITVYKEKLSKAQICGYFTGIASVILLNIGSS